MNSQAARMVYNNAIKSVMKAFGLKSPQAVLQTFKLTQSTLRLELPFVTGNNSFAFKILVNQTSGGIFNTETRLDLQDSFVLSSLGFFVGLPNGNDADAQADDNTFLPDAYLNPFKYTNAIPMGAIYNSNLELSVNRNILIPEWDMWKHWQAPETQATAAPGAGSPIDEVRGAIDGFYPVEPNITCIGSKNTQIILNLKGPGITAVDTGSRMVLMLRGILVQNSTVVS